MSALLLASLLSPAAPAVASVGPLAQPCTAGDALHAAVASATFANDQAIACFALGHEGLGYFWLGLASDALEAAP